MTDTAHLQTKAQAAGLDWSKLADFIKNLDWAAMIAFVQMVIGIWRGAKPKMAKADVAGSDSECIAGAKAHFEAIEALARCGNDCCG